MNKIAEFLCSHFNTEDGKKATFLAYYALLVQEKKKHNWKTSFVQFMEKLLWLIKYITSGLWSFMLEISRWTMLRSWVDRLTLIAIKSRHELRIINVIPHGTQPTYSKSSFQIKCWKPCVPAWYVNHFDIWVSHMWSEKNLLDGISTCNSLLKRNEMFCF